MIFNLKKLFPFLYRTQWLLKPEHETELAFISGGVEYYCLTNGFNVYFERYQAGMDAINALENRVSRDYLKTHVGLTNEYLNKGELSKIAVLNRHLEERLDHICNVDLFYQLASIWYFDKSENCYAYNQEYAEKKIALWRKDKDLLSFFLKSPIGKLMPLQSIFQQNIQKYTRAQRLELKAALSYHLLQQSETPSNKDLISRTKSQIAVLDALLTQAE